MASTMLRSGIQAAIRRGGRTARPQPQPKRNFSSSAHNDEYETAKWEKITYLGIATCTALAIYCLSKGHHHSEPPPVSLLILCISIFEDSKQGVPVGYVVPYLIAFRFY
ncbi:hypothetical protein Scep_001296 [Stephania cephalantha]|uniref:Uncharacterized protein n=1 Tax=Stephania cephalantha TaxID=152367 RepID=A0AAP0Q3N1_9MAGN